MSNHLSIDDQVLLTAGAALVYAAHQLSNDNVQRPEGDLHSLTGVGPTVSLFLDALNTARAALADAAHTASGSLAAVMREATQLDQQISASLGADYQVECEPRQ